jgi:signal transduction histidine kinase
VAVAQFAPALIGGLFWRGAVKAGAIAGISAGFAVWCYTLLIPSFTQTPAIADFVAVGPFGIDLLRPYALFGLNGLDPVTHATFWSLLANVGALLGVSMLAQQRPVDRAHAALFVDPDSPAEAARIWRRTGLIPDLNSLAARFLGRQRTSAAFASWARERGLDPATAIKADAETVLFYERLLASVIGAASARVLVGAIVEEEPLGVDEVMRILDETSRVIEANRRLEEKSEALEDATTELRQANARLKELDRLKDDFIATVNHELRTPLASIRAFSEIVRDHSDLDDEQRREFLRIVVHESERLTRLIGQLLDLSKMSEGGLPARLAPVDLVGVAQDSLAAMRQMFVARDVALDTRLEVDRAMVMGDHDRLVQVLINLLGNAAKFAPRVRGEARLSLRRVGGDFEFAVADNGPGIAPGDREVVFERFRQLGDTMNNKPEGAGLGLAISQRIIIQHGGRIWIDDAPGGGAVFRVELPAEAGAI